MIELTHLHKTYLLPNNTRIQALKDVTLSVKKGEIFGVIGESGAGKSTLIRCVNRLETPESGQIRVDGQDLMRLKDAELRAARRKMGMIFQHFNLLNSKTVYQNIAFPLELAKCPSSTIREKVHTLLEFTGLMERKNHYPNQLSGGQKQRVAIARALANQPKILLSDEATSALDPETKHSILQLLKKINEEFNLTILLITHEMSVIKEICHRLAVFEQGSMIEKSDVLTFFSHPDSETAKKFIRSIALHDLPASLKKRLHSEVSKASMPLWRLSFVGKASEEPLIAHLAREFELNLNIIQAHIEEIRDERVGVMLVEVGGEPEKVTQGKHYLTNKGVFVELIGHVQPAY